MAGAALALVLPAGANAQAPAAAAGAKGDPSRPAPAAQAKTGEVTSDAAAETPASPQAADPWRRARQAAWQPQYPMPLLQTPCLGLACGPLQIVDLQLDAGNGPTPTQAGFRIRAGGGYLGVESGQHRTTVSLTSTRLSVRYRDDDGRVASVAYRAPRLRFGLQAEQDTPALGAGWRLTATAAYRFSPDLEVQVRGVRDLEDDRPRFLPPMVRSLGRVGLLWQHSTSLDLRVGVRGGRLQNGLGERVRVWGADLQSVLMFDPVEARLGLDYEDVGGRFSRRDLTAKFGLRARVLDHLVAEAGIEERVQLGVSEVRRTARGGLAWYGRRFRFARSSEVGAAVLALTRRAWERGYNEPRVYDVEGMRALRERLALAGIIEPTAQLYRATVLERNVPQLELHFASTQDRESGETIREVRVGVAVPWRPESPWRTGEERTRFLRVIGSYEESRLGGMLRETGRGVDLELLLNRELAALVGWQRPRRTPLQLAFSQKPQDVVRVSLRWAFWR